jgi:serine/threonine protein kinase/tetratricopeptide (TPR) repeat protein
MQPEVTETLKTPIKELTTGSTFAGRYQIIEELGRGGMGRVYKVHDTKIGEKIALKLIRPEAVLDRKTVERFSNELKLARKIRHKNICQMFDLGEDQGTHYITMEYIHGEDLKQLIRKVGRLSPGQAIGIARQVCDGLEEAHKLAVVHRDLKPQNIMIDEDGNARIMDFGIARSLTGKGITGAGVMIGTPEYMSPEQVEGKDTHQRSDIYSLGVILYEMATGRVPFEGDTPFTIGVKHKSEPPKDPRELNSQLPEDLSRLILRCLEKDKNARYQTAAEVGAELEKIEKGIPTTDRIVPERKTLTSREITVTFGLKKIAISVLAVIVVAAAVLFLWKPWARGKMPLIAAGKPSLAVLYFENISQDRSLDDWITGIPQLLMTDLGQSKLISVLGYDEVYGILQALGLKDAQKYSSSDLTRIARQSQATHMITGSILKPGDKIIITLVMKESSGKDSRPWSEGFECSGEAEIPAVVDRMTAKIKQALGLTRSQISGDFDALAVNITTSSIEALKLYNEGRRLYVAGKSEESIPLMLMAVEKDPEFAMAYRSLSMALWSQGRMEEAGRYIQKAWQFSGKASPKERFWIQINYYSSFSEKTFDKALETCQKWLDLYPDDTHAMMLTGFWHMNVEDFDQAIKFLDMSIQKGNVSPFSYYYLAGAYTASGAYEKGRQAAERGLSMHPDNSLIESALFDNYVSQGKIDEAQALLEKRAAKDHTLLIDLMMGDLKAIQGKYDEAAAIFTKYDPLNFFIKPRLSFLRLSEGKIHQAMELARNAEDHLALIYLNYRAGNFEGALAESQKALQDALKKGSLSNQARTLQMRGLVELALGDLPAAQRTAEELKKCVEGAVNKKLVHHHYFLAGMIEGEAGRYADAVDYLNKAIALFPAKSWEFDSVAQWNPIFFNGLAAVYFKSGDLGRAKEEYRRIQSLALVRLQYGDIYAASFYWLGKIAEKEGKKDEAAENYRKFLDLWKDADPGLPEVEDAKKSLAALK